MTKKSEKKPFFNGTGRRKRAVARVWLYAEKGEFTINGKPAKDYFTEAEAALEWVKPFHAIGVSHPQSKFSGSIKVQGGGNTGQVEAVRLGVARALVAYDETLRAILRTSDLMTRDSREVERKKPGQKKARKKFQFSKR